MSSEGANPHSQEVSTKSRTLRVNKRTAPKRWVSHPVSGTEMALATPKLVITQVPWLGLTPRSPAIAGRDTLAIEESSTFMNVARDSDRVPSSSCAPCSGVGSVCGLAVVELDIVCGFLHALSAAAWRWGLRRFVCGPDWR